LVRSVAEESAKKAMAVSRSTRDIQKLVECLQLLIRNLSRIEMG